jgi:uncharacterized membrane protein YccC
MTIYQLSTLVDVVLGCAVALVGAFVAYQLLAFRPR